MAREFDEYEEAKESLDKLLEYIDVKEGKKVKGLSEII